MMKNLDKIYKFKVQIELLMEKKLGYQKSLNNNWVKLTLNSHPQHHTFTSSELRCVRTLSKRDTANMVINALLLMVRNNWWQRQMFLFCTKPSYAKSTCKLDIVPMVKDVNSFMETRAQPVAQHLDYLIQAHLCHLTLQVKWSRLLHVVETQRNQSQNQFAETTVLADLNLALIVICATAEFLHLSSNRKSY